MPLYRSKLFRRNNGGVVTKKPYAKRKAIYVERGAPRPARSPISHVNTAERKQITGSNAVLALKDVGQVFHLDQVTQGPGSTQRLGQKYRVTGVHIRGDWSMQLATRRDCVGYFLVWDKQPNEILANPGDILDLSSSADSSKAFPNPDTDGRFIYLGRKQHTATVGKWGATSADTEFNDSSAWHPDDYWDFSDRRLIASNLLSGNGTISDRSSGALLMVGIGQNAAQVSNVMDMHFRVYFEDV